MSAPVFIGDAITAAGYRLAGARVIVPGAGETAEALASARREASLVVITAELAEHVPAAQLAEATRALSPLVLVVPDARGRVAAPDVVRAVRRDLGVG